MSQNKALIDQLLTNVSIGYMPTGYLADVALPELIVNEYSGLIGKYTNQHLKKQNTKMQGEGKAKRVKAISYDVSEGFLVEPHGLSDVITKQDLHNIPQPFSVESDKVLGLTSLLKIDKEVEFSAIMTSSSVITNGVTLSGTSQWDDYAASKPINDIATARAAVKAASGFFPNRAIISARLAEVLSYHPSVITNLGFQYEKAGALTYEDIKKFMKVDELHVGDVQMDTAAEGQTESMAELWGADVVLYYAPKTGEKMQKSFGYKLSVAGQSGYKVYKAPVDNPPESTEVIVTDDYGFKITNSACAYLIQDAI